MKLLETRLLAPCREDGFSPETRLDLVGTGISNYLGMPNERPGLGAAPMARSREGHEVEHTLAAEQTAHVVHTTRRMLANQNAYSRHEVQQLLAH